jgi:hypothetical protein
VTDGGSAPAEPGAPPRPRAPSPEPRAAAGQRLAGFIYGTIVALSVTVAGARAYPDSPGRIGALVTATCIVFWVAHVYAHALGRSVAHEEHLSLAELRRIARREGAIVEAAVPPLAALLLGALGVLSPEVAQWLALGAGLVVLAAQGIVFARIEHLGRLGGFLVVAANLALGLTLAAVKLALPH